MTRDPEAHLIRDARGWRYFYPVHVRLDLGPDATEEQARDAIVAAGFWRGGMLTDYLTPNDRGGPTMHWRSQPWLDGERPEVDASSTDAVPEIGTPDDGRDPYGERAALSRLRMMNGGTA